MAAIGIDLGTSYSCVAVWKNNRPEIIKNMGKHTTPSYVAFTSTQQLVGKAAKDQAPRNPLNTVFDVKRFIGRRFSDPEVQEYIKVKQWPFEVIAGPNDKPMIVVNEKGVKKQFAPEQISAMVLTKMREIAEKHLGETIKEAVVTVPAYFTHSQRVATRDAAKLARLNVVHLINEPTAAAIAYGLDKKKTGKENVLIFDLGGGTLDVSFLTIEGGKFDVKAATGEPHLGGQDFDRRLLDYVIVEVKKQHKKDIRQNKKVLSTVMRECEEAKITLSSADEVPIEGEIDGIEFSINITRAKFIELNDDLFKKCKTTVEKCLKDANMNASSVDDVVLIGGSSRIPRVQELLEELFKGKKLSESIDPDEAVASGAAALAAQGSPDVPVVWVSDVTPLSLGIEVVGHLFDAVVPRNAKIPIKNEKIFTTNADNQRSVRFSVYQGERSNVDDDYLLDEFALSGIALAPRKVPKLNVVFDIDANGILDVSAKDRTRQEDA